MGEGSALTASVPVANSRTDDHDGQRNVSEGVRRHRTLRVITDAGHGGASFIRNVEEDE